MKTIAYKFNNACAAGLTLVGTETEGEERGQPQWLGTKRQWTDYENMNMADEMIHDCTLDENGEGHCDNIYHKLI